MGWADMPEDTDEQRIKKLHGLVPYAKGLEVSVVTWKASLVNLNHYVDEIRGKCLSAKGTIKTLNKKLEEQNQTLYHQENEIADQKIQIESDARAIQGLDEKVEKLRQTIVNLEKQSNEPCPRCEEIERQMLYVEENLRNMEGLRDQQAQQAQLWRQSSERYDQEVNSLKARIVDLTEEIDELKGKIQDKDEDIIIANLGYETLYDQMSKREDVLRKIIKEQTARVDHRGALLSQTMAVLSKLFINIENEIEGFERKQANGDTTESA